MKGLIIEEPWISLILSGAKDWEIKKTHCRVLFTRMALVRQGSGLIVGTAEIWDSRQFAISTLLKYRSHHRCTQAQLEEYANGKALYAWKLGKVRALKRPVPYDHVPGSQSRIILPANILTGAR